MTRDTEHTPSPQSVVVPVEDLLFYKLKDLITEQSEGEWTDEMVVKDAHHFANHLRPLIAAAPVPSSLAGGEATKPADTSWSDWPRKSHDRRYEIGLRSEQYAAHNCPFCDNEICQSSDVVIVGDNGGLAIAHTSCIPEECEDALAALSPEAPAREGVEGPPREPTQTMMDALLYHSSHDTNWEDAYTMWTAAHDTWFRDGPDATALTPRHEAPAEGCRCQLPASECHPDCPHKEIIEAPAEGAGEMAAAVERLTNAADFLEGDCVIVGDHEIRGNDISAVLSALRARSSAPEAREGEAPVRGEIRVINGKRCRFIERELEGDKWEVIGPAHPAAPSADKLRIAVEALERIEKDADEYRTNGTEHDAGFEKGLAAAAYRADQALAALKAEGAK